MQNRIEPPILLSRLMSFVLATAVVVLVVMGITLYKMFPLNRPQVFFLMTQNNHTLDVTLRSMEPIDKNLDVYKNAFIKEYIKARNEIISDADVMRKKWMRDTSAAVRAWSSDEVFSAFEQTKLWTAFINGAPDFEFQCPVEFEKGAISTRGTNKYAVKFRWFCENSDGQVAAKDYTITLELGSDIGKETKWIDRLTNPLGLRVVKYAVESVDGDKSNHTDPLDRFWE